MSARTRMWVHARRGPRGVHPHALLSTQPRYTYMPQLLLHTHTREGVLLKCSVIAQAITVYWSDRVRGCDTCTVHALGPFTPRALSRTLAISLSLLAAPCGHATRARCVTAESGCALHLRAWPARPRLRRDAYAVACPLQVGFRRPPSQDGVRVASPAVDSDSCILFRLLSCMAGMP